MGLIFVTVTGSQMNRDMTVPDQKQLFEDAYCSDPRQEQLYQPAPEIPSSYVPPHLKGSFQTDETRASRSVNVELHRGGDWKAIECQTTEVNEDKVTRRSDFNQ